MKKNLIIFLLVPFLLQGCLSVKLMNPRPNLNLAETKQTIALIIDEGVKDIFTIPAQNGVRKASVTDWRTSLKNGFESGFGNFYTIIDDDTKSDLVLKITRTDVAFAPAAVGYNGVVAAIRAQITFNATLYNKNGEVIGRSSGTSVSKSAVGGISQLTSCVASATESMYELIGEKCFQ